MRRPNPQREDAEITSRLHRVVSLTQSMIALAEAGEALDDIDSRRVFLALRDSGYELRRLATDEIEKRDAQTADRARPSAQPAADEPETLPSRSEPPPGESLGKRVLLVDDDPDVVRYLEAWFHDRGFETATATGGQEALERASTTPFDLITLDMSMPEVSGAETYQALKSVSGLRHVPVIVITALTDARKVFPLHLDALPSPEGFLAKPIDLSELGRFVKKLVEPNSSSRPYPTEN